MVQVWLSRKKIEQQLQSTGASSSLCEHFGLSAFWRNSVFSATYSANDQICNLIKLTNIGNDIVRECQNSLGVLKPDATLAIYGYFAHHEVFVDCENTPSTYIIDLLQSELSDDRIRLPFFWGRELVDRFAAHPEWSELDFLPHSAVWQLLSGDPVGVFQHGLLISGPAGIVRSTEHRWMPVRTAVTCFYREGTRKRSRTVGYQPASIGVVEAFSWISEFLLRSHGPQSEWRSALAWFQNRQCTEPRTDYCDVGPIIADCVLGQDRTVLLEEVLKTKDGDLIRDGILKSQFGKDFKGLPPKELARRFDRNQQLQLLLVASTDILVKTLDRLVLANQIGVPTSELRYARKRLPKRNVCFHSELSSLGIRPAHPEPYAALNSAILRAYRETGSLSELSWRLGSDPSRGVQVTLTEIVRNEGPAEAVAKLVLASQPVTEIICRELGLDLREIIPRTNRTIPRILWKFGFEIPRHEPVLIHLNRRMTHFEETLAEVDYGAGEKAKEKIRESGVNLFVSVEELLDHLISYNVWLLSSDHWGKTEFEYRLSEARKSVSNTLGTSIASVDGEVQWKVNGENALGTQLAYLSELDKWLDSLTEAKKVARQDVAIEHAVDDFNRPFPFRHTQLWADSDFVELERYKDTFRKIAKSILQADIAGIRNALDHQRGESRFPSEEQLLLCVTRLRMGVRAAEQSRIYPVTYWFNSSTDRVFGASEHRFENAQGEILTIYRPSTVSSLPSITRIHPVIFAPVNFFGAADSLLFFKRMGESDYSRYWSDFPPISKLIVDSDDEFDAEQIDGETVSSISE